MAFTHQFGFFDVSQSINYFLKNNLGTNVPAWFTWSYGASQPRSLNFNWPDQPLNFPSFSVTHHASDPVGYFQGDKADGAYKGIMRQGLMEVNCWVSEMVGTGEGQVKNHQWMQQLLTMRDMVFSLLQKNRSIALYDCTDANNLVALNSIARFADIRETAVLPDPNPSVKRIRISITYTWIERWT